MGLPVVPAEPRRLGGLGQHRLPIGQPRQGHGIEDAEGVEGVVLVLGAIRQCLDKAQVETGVVPHQDSPIAAGGAYRPTDGGEDAVDRLMLGDGVAEGVIRVDLVEGQGPGVDLGTEERAGRGRPRCPRVPAAPRDSCG